MSNIFKLYHYKSLDSFEHFNYLKNYIEQKVWMTPLNNFNDPFEGNFKLTSFSPQDILYNPQLKQHYFEIFKKEPEYANLTEAEFVDLLSNPNLLNELIKNNQTLVESLFSQHGAICFTSDCSNIPMWSHYANNHTGYCVIFDFDFNVLRQYMKIPTDFEFNQIKESIKNGSRILSFTDKKQEHEFVFAKIKYEKSPPILSLSYVKSLKDNDSGEATITEYIVNHSVGVKYFQWEYEQEYRLITNTNSTNGGLVYLPYYAPFLKVTGIIIGSEMQEKNKKLIQNFCINKNIELFNAVLSREEYKIKI